MGGSERPTLLVSVLLVAMFTSLCSRGAATIEEGNALQEVLDTKWITRSMPSWVIGTDPCVAVWMRLDCDTTGHVVTLNLTHVGLSGEIPMALGKLTSLKVLDMGNDKNCEKCGPWNRVKGDLAALSTLVNLQTLILTSNELSLDIFPSSIFKLTKLVNLRVDNTLIRGKFPYQLSTLTNLQILYLGNNSFTGPLDGGPLSKLVNLHELTIWNSPFYSVCPPELGKLVNLTYLNLNKCGLYGGLPPEYSKLTKLEKLILFKNNFTGPIPDSWRSMVNLKDFEINNNYLYGPLPTWLLQFPKLAIIRGTNNNLYGPLPPGLNETYTPGLRNISMECNYLNGNRPSVSQNITASLQYNCFVGDTNSDSACIRPQNCLNFQLATGNGTRCPACPPDQHPVNLTTCICFKDEVKSSKKFGIGAIIGVTVGGAVLMIFLMTLAYFFLFKRKSKAREGPKSRPDFFSIGKEVGSMRYSSALWEVPNGVQRFTLEELTKATDGFDKAHEIGEGGFGKVFVGHFPDGRTLALKRAAPVFSPNSGAGHQQFRNEVLLLSRLHHKNLVRLEGFCDEEDYQILVYEFMKLGNLHSLLHEDHRGKNAGKYIMLDWYKRLEIALHIAQGLDYLHSFADPPVIHRDVKPSNILLDENLVAKVADFGISRESPEIDTHVSTRPAGTAGYFDPQYFLRRQLTTASDVYSFGVVLLELITGRRAIVLNSTSDEDTNLIEWTKLRREQSKDGNVASIVDCKLEGKYPQETYAKLVDLALMCASFEKSRRPSMKHVVSVLEPLLQSAERPTQNYTLQQWPSHEVRTSPSSSHHSTMVGSDEGCRTGTEYTRIEMATLLLPR
ncbi:uncharacterized protein [Physcomitrium patens]|uniref:uncharacterized protein isoform X1 n=1 Tax=Physcomitrium patens TaxID=3218 RepID=UPI000D157618|nr:probable LRR receptor-like serine/threonine-protein kinase At5g37450 isoform X3 [Physcomitrium patens]|eukprot:XP_024393935.1 probable LRR receptor-like serine/threonine-protein kinase At5g37450 isoform X3 [Physcomitrella patens]